MEYFAYRDGELCVEQVPLEQIAATYGTPTYVYSSNAISDAYHRFDSAFAGRDHRTCYSVKANSNLGILSLLVSLGASFDIISGGELERVRRAGAAMDQVVFSGCGKQDWEINEALLANIACFNIESINELQQINRIAAELDCIAPISIRVNPDVDPKTHAYISTGLRENKFGVSTQVALEIYALARQSRHIKIVGIDCHIGSQITQLAPFTEAVQRIVEIVDKLEDEGIKLEHIDLGGGIGIQYRNENTVDINEYAAAIIQCMGHRQHQLIFEPGRYIVAQAGILLSSVINLKQNGDKNFAIIDAAMNDLLRPALYQSWQDISVVRPTNAPARRYDIVGPICESADFLAKDRELVIDTGGLIAIHSTGAYGFVMSSNYNSRNRAAEVMVNGAEVQCVRDRESIEDQLRLERVYQPVKESRLVADP